VVCSVVASAKRGLSLVGMIAYFSGDYLELDKVPDWALGLLRFLASLSSLFQHQTPRFLVVDEI
jgi:hypothetical protein